VAFNVNGTEANDDDSSKLKSASNVENLTTFGIILKKSSESSDYINSINHFVNLNPSMIDYEIRSLAPLSGGSISLMDKFLKMIIEMFNSNKNFELAQSYLALFLKSHEEIIFRSKTLMKTIDELEVAQNKCWSTLEEQLLYSIGVVSNLRNYC